MLIFEERGKPENQEKNLSQQSKEPTTNLNHSWATEVGGECNHHYAIPAPHKFARFVYDAYYINVSAKFNGFSY